MQPNLLKAIKEILGRNHSLVFAYFYGSSKDSVTYNDIDIAVFSTLDIDPFRLSIDFKIALLEKTGINTDIFDMRVINHLLGKGDFAQFAEELEAYIKSV